MSISLDTIRTGKKYFFRNFGEERGFQVLEILGNGDFKVKDLLTLEEYFYSELVQFGKGKDFQLFELDNS